MNYLHTLNGEAVTLKSVKDTVKAEGEAIIIDRFGNVSVIITSFTPALLAAAMVEYLAGLEGR